MKLRFEVNPEYDIKTFFNLLRQEHWESRIPGSGIPYELAKKIHEATADEEIQQLYNELEKIALEQYELNREAIEQAKEAYQKSWNEIIDEFSETVADLTKPWFYDEYVCNITHLCKGVSNWNGNVIGRT